MNEHVEKICKIIDDEIEWHKEQSRLALTKGIPNIDVSRCHICSANALENIKKKIVK